MGNVIKQFKFFLKPGLFQFSIVLLLITFNFVYYKLNLPNSSIISDFFINKYSEYGLIIIFFAAFLEGLFMLSIYLPGSLVIVLSAFALGFDIKTLFQIGIISLAGFSSVNIINYYLGRYGYYKILLKLGGKSSIDKVQNDFNKHPFKTIFLTSFHPNFLAITMISAGISKSNLLKTLLQSIVSLIFWITLWMSIVYIFFKDSSISFTENDNQTYYLIGIILLWGIMKCFLSYKKNKSNL